MGLNLDLKSVWFAGSSKFDGRKHRRLEPQELAQIAGRAGRHTSDGSFGVSGDLPPFDDELIEAIETPKSKMIELVKEAIQQGQKKPDVIYMTGGSARSPILRQAVEEAVPNVPIVSGNYFGSVTAGLARWAEVCFK